VDYRYNCAKNDNIAKLLSNFPAECDDNKQRMNIFLSRSRIMISVSSIDSAGKRGQLRTRAAAESTVEIKVAVKKASQSYGSILHAGFSHRFGYNAPRR